MIHFLLFGRALYGDVGRGGVIETYGKNLTWSSIAWRHKKTRHKTIRTVAFQIGLFDHYKTMAILGRNDDGHLMVIESVKLDNSALV